MLKHESDLTEDEKKKLDEEIELDVETNGEQLPDEFDEEEGCVPPKEDKWKLFTAQKNWLPHNTGIARATIIIFDHE